MDNSTENLLDTKEAARHLKMHFNTLEKKRSTGDGPAFVKLGRIVRYRIEDLDAWVDARRCKSTFDETYLSLTNASE